MQKYILLLGITILLGSIYLINQKNESDYLPETADYAARYLQFKAKFGKRYGSSEDIYRQAVFTENMIKADLHNANPESTFTMGETQFADLKQQEFVDIYLSKMYKKEENYKKVAKYSYPIFDGPKTYPAAFDWRKYPGVTSKVKSQGYCGSCWAFSAASEVEAYFAVKKGILNLDLSEQQLIDCDKEDDNSGCLGGNENYALEHVARYGITTENVYPYTGQDGNCQMLTGPYQFNELRQVLPNDNALKSALSVQPVTVGVESSNWYLYTGGIFNQCNSGGPIDHAVIAVGYEANAWIIKNSWGTDWGEKGYIRLNCNYVLQYIFVAV